MRKSNQINNLNVVVSRAVSNFKPPEDITVVEWADKYRCLPEMSAEPGPWRTSRTPYLTEPMEAFTDPKVRNLVMVSSSQIGKTELELNITGYIIDIDPGSILYIHPDLDNARKFSKERIAPMIKACKRLRSKVAESKSRDSDNTILKKSFPGGRLTICGSNSAAALASSPVRYVIGDERDRWAASAGTEGDPWGLAKARQITFTYNAKSVEVSTPTVKNASAIEKSFNKGTQERWCHQCPDCGEWHNIIFADIHFEYDEQTIKGKKSYTVKSVEWICPFCKCCHTEREMKRQPAKWVAENPDAYKNGVRSFWLNAFSSPWATWESIVLAFLEAKGDTEKMQVVFNTMLGELWENRGELADEDTMMARRETYEAELPDGVLCITCGVDTQDNRLEYEVVGHGHFGEIWGIRKGIIMGRPDDPEVWTQLDDVINHEYSFKDGTKLRISATFVDSGGHFTQDVYIACRERENKKVYAIKGRGGDGIPYTAPPKKTNIVVDGIYIGQCWLYTIGVDSGKQIIMDSLKTQVPGAKYCHFPNNKDLGYGTEFFNGLLSERLEYNYKKKKNKWEWVIIPGHERNEPLDCRNYANAAFKAMAKDLDAVERRIKEMQCKRKANKAQKSPAEQQAPKRKQGRGSGIDKYYEEW